MHKTGKEEEEVLAIICCDSFKEEMGPITLDIPRCLIPLNNIPLIVNVFP